MRQEVKRWLQSARHTRRPSMFTPLIKSAQENFQACFLDIFMKSVFIKTNATWKAGVEGACSVTSVFTAFPFLGLAV